jgi:hypothetical protein
MMDEVCPFLFLFRARPFCVSCASLLGLLLVVVVVVVVVVAAAVAAFLFFICRESESGRE